MLEKERRIGLFGGTFDPVHEGHLAVARYAATALDLDQVVFIPAADPPHKRKTTASFSHRAAMLDIALSGQGQEDGFEISLTEAQRPAPSYTVDTLLELQQIFKDQRLFFIIGADSLLEIHLWYRYTQLFSLTDFIVVSRPGISFSAVCVAIDSLPGDFIRQGAALSWQRRDGAAIFYLSESDVDVSSSSIRQELQRGGRPQALMAGVQSYIDKNHLYAQKP